jgi:uncharacterized membrane protein
MYSALIVGALVLMLLTMLDLGSEKSGSHWATRHPDLHFSHAPTRLALVASGFFLAVFFSVSTIAQALQRVGIVFVALPILLTGLGLTLLLAYRWAAPFRGSLCSVALKPSIEPDSLATILLPRASGLGYTLNFSHPRARRLMVLLLVAPLVVVAVGVALG